MNWNKNLADTIKNINDESFTESLVTALGACVVFDYSVMFAYRGNDVPIDLYDSFEEKRRTVYVGQYQEGPYLLDPFYQACLNATESGLYRLKELAPDRFYQSEYYRSYYKKTELAEEIGFFIHLPQNAYIVISLMRTSQRSVFSQKEMRYLREIEPVIRALAEKHWKDVYLQFEEESGKPKKEVIFQEQMEAAFGSFGRSILTKRELEVVGLVLRGYSSEAIAEILHIAKGTVKTYRRSIYAKLSISSQSELFSMFLSSLSS